MANSNQLRRYFLIYQCVSQRKFPSLENIGEYLDEHDIKISERTLQRDIANLRTKFSLWPTYDYEKGGYHFSPDDLKYIGGILRFLEIAYLADNLKTENYAKYVSYGEAELLQGIDHVPLLLEAINSQSVITFNHENYQKGTIKQTSLEPYLIREYLNRWYVIGYKKDTNELRTFGVDRMRDLKNTNQKFQRKENVSLHTLFEHVIGVVYDADKLLKVEFKVPVSQRKYMDSLPLHKSQLHLTDINNESHYQMEVVHNYELEQKLLMHSIFLTVTGPANFAEYFAEKIRQINARYEH